eukprot:CAMPEP_0185025500 /NCGR_PEP_ID=MMETSP1103-20130426/8429_1 /TAXON_ID=36769 /ORGANISM="Paraphysomonas bandaiensis, Strain Caron Lab Isolate" /LENGTH=453 /DNA_ID=CAMNT_0027558705 /DNA_START=70 /DNA_END=1431 /DNA_ORIENTATION=+
MGANNKSSSSFDLVISEMRNLGPIALDPVLSPCHFCGRTFYPKSLVVHNRSCTFETPHRRVDEPVSRWNVYIRGKKTIYNSANARAYGTDLWDFQRKIANLPPPSISPKHRGGKVLFGTLSGEVSKWRFESEALRHGVMAARRRMKAMKRAHKETIRRAEKAERKAEKEDFMIKRPIDPTRSSSPLDGIIYSTYVQCPTCSRTFDRSVGYRHIEKCANIKHRPTTLHPHSGHLASLAHVDDIPLVKCEYCDRTFAPARLEVHNRSCCFETPARRVDEPVCRRGVISRSTRTVYNSASARARGTELEAFLADTAKLPPPAVSPKHHKGGKIIPGTFSDDVSKWRYQSEALRHAAIAGRRLVRAKKRVAKAKWDRAISRMREEEKAKKMAPHKSPPRTDPVYESYMQCPTCRRFFEQGVAMRHIDVCKHVIHRPTTLHAHTGHLAAFAHQSISSY